MYVTLSIDANLLDQDFSNRGYRVSVALINIFKEQATWHFVCPPTMYHTGSSPAWIEYCHWNRYCCLSSITLNIIVTSNRYRYSHKPLQLRNMYRCTLASPFNWTVHIYMWSKQLQTDLIEQWVSIDTLEKLLNWAIIVVVRHPCKPMSLSNRYRSTPLQAYCDDQ